MKIFLKDIEKSFDKKQIIDNATIDFEAGSFTTLLGPSGCGKTTLLRMISGLERPDKGEIWFGEKCVFSAKQNINLPPEQRGLGFVFQDFALWPHMTIFENVAYGLRARNDKANLKERVEKALDAVHLERFGNRYPHQLSGGQQQRVALARAIVIKPKCILFDEPLSALDALLREEMGDEIKRLVTEMGITAIFVTHDQTEAMGLSDKIIVLNSGVIEQEAAPEEIYHHPATPFVAKFIGRSNWIGDTAMFRPEAAGMQPFADNSKRFRMRVKSVQFVGNAYELCLENEAFQWIIHSANKVAPKNEVDIFVKEDKILQFIGA